MSKVFYWTLDDGAGIDVSGFKTLTEVSFGYSGDGYRAGIMFDAATALAQFGIEDADLPGALAEMCEALMSGEMKPEAGKVWFETARGRYVLNYLSFSYNREEDLFHDVNAGAYLLTK